MEISSCGGGRVWTNLYASYERRRNGEKLSWDWKVLKIPRDDEILQDFSPINANAAPISIRVRKNWIQNERKIILTCRSSAYNSAGQR